MDADWSDGSGEGARLRLAPSAARRAAGAGTLGALGAILLWLTAAAPPAAPGWLAFLLAVALGAIAAAAALWRATGTALELTGSELREAGPGGRVLARIEAIRSVDRGVFAFKPSSGFVLTLTAAPGPSAWAPGLWWRVGRRVGVGGVLRRHETRAAAEALEVLIARRGG